MNAHPPFESSWTSSVVVLAGRLLTSGLAAAVCLLPAGPLAKPSTPMTAPELPRQYVDTTPVAASGRTIAVPAGGNFQAALNAAQPGDVISLEAGATFTGPFTLPNKPGTGWIVVRTSAPDRSLPPPGTRVDPSYAGVMPKLESASGWVVGAAAGAHHYRFVGIEIRPRQGTFLYNLALLGLSETSEDRLPHHLIFERCYLHGDSKKGSRRGIAMNSRHTAVLDSYFSDFKEVGADSQAIQGWNGSGPFKIVNNYLEAAGENLIFGGGADPTIPNLVPSDVEIRRNHFSKPLSWKMDDPTYLGTPWTVKNLFELKNARRVIVEGNLFEQNWVHAQAGYAIVLTVRNERGSSPWSVVEDITFVNNIVRHTASGVNVLGRDDNYPSQQTKRILIKNNLFDDIGGPRWGGNGRLFVLLRGTADVVIDHNTAFQTDAIILAEGDPHQGFVFQNNIVAHNETGVFGGGKSPGLAVLTHFFPNVLFTRNVIVGYGLASRYPPDNFYPASFAGVGFTDRAGGDYRLADSSAYRKAGTDGKDIGVDVDALTAAQAPPR